MNRLHAATVTALALTLAACVDVPDPAAPVDAAALDSGATDAAPDIRPDDPDTGPDDPDGGPLGPDSGPVGPDSGPDPDAGPLDPDSGPDPDAGPLDPDMGPPPPPDCLPQLGGQPADDGLCLEVFSAAPLPAARIHAAGGTVTAFADRPRLVVAGGYALSGAPGPADARSWIYDPIEDEWSEGPALNTARWGAAAAIDDTGALVLVGGSDAVRVGGGWTGLASAERFDGADWSEVPGTLEPGRAQAAAVPIGDGRVLVLGGRVDSNSPPTANGDRIDSERIGGLADVLTAARAEAAATALPDGRILVVGGRGAVGTAQRVVEIGTAEGRGFTPTPGPLLGGVGSGIASLSDGALIVGGVTDDAPTGSREVWRFTAAYDRAVPISKTATPRIHPSVTPIGPPGGDWRLVVGGDEAGIVELYDPRTERMRAFALPAPWDHGRRLHVAAAVPLAGPDGEALEVVVVGGVRLPMDDGAPITEVLRFRLTPPPPVVPPPPLPEGCLPLTEALEDGPCLRVRRGPPLPWAAGELSAGTNPDGRVFVAGGLDPDAPAGERVRGDSALLELGGPVWRAGPPLSQPRWGHAMRVSNLWNNPSAYLYGGSADDPDALAGEPYLATADIERWDLALDTWSSIGALGQARMDGAFAPLGALDGGWWVGGLDRSDGRPLESGVQVVRGIHTPLPALTIARADGALCRSDDTMLIYGGYAGGRVIDTVEAGVIGEPWLQLELEVAPRFGAGCLGQPDYVDFFGGNATHDGPPTASWLRLLRSGDRFETRALPDLSRGRLQPTVSRIGIGSGRDAAWLIVGGEDPDDGAPPVVDLVFPEADGADGKVVGVRLPEGVGLRHEHAAVSREVRRGPETLLDREVVVVGGFDRDGVALDEVLIFTLDPPVDFGPQPPDGMQ